MEERIVCAANRNKQGDVVVGVRHWDFHMHSQVRRFEESDRCVDTSFVEQGFITNKGRFVDRYEAWSIAVKNNQIIRRCGGDTANGGCLYSENLY